MANDLSLCDFGTFGPIGIASLRAAFRIGCERLQLTPASDVLRDRLAVAIMDAARSGFRDPAAMARVALNRLAIVGIVERERGVEAPAAGCDRVH